MQTIGEFIKYMREYKNLTQWDLAQRVKLDSSFISKIETGTRKMSFDTAEKVLRALISK